jgi:hypothetical protein
VVEVPVITGLIIAATAVVALTVEPPSAVGETRAKVKRSA